MAKKKNIQRKRQAAEQRRPFAFCESYDVVVVGAGASGLACAVSCVRQMRAAGCALPSILVVEQGKRIGAPILRSGNGRCNFSNSQLQVERFWNGAFVSQTLESAGGQSGVSMNPVVRWFEELGLVWSEAHESQGLLYPFSNKASSVLEVLTAALPPQAVDLHTCVKACAISPAADSFEVRLEEVPATGKGTSAQDASSESPKRATVRAKNVVLAAGGGFSGSLLAECAPTVELLPWHSTLGPLAAAFPEGVATEELDGIRAQARISLPSCGFSEEGEVLFRGYGISGIVVFNASRYAKPGDTLLVDFLPGMSEEETLQLVQSRAKRSRRLPAISLFQGFMLPELGRALLAAACVQPDKPAGDEECRRIAGAMKAFPLQVQGIADEKQCQVRRGGIAPNEVRAETLEMKKHPGLYALGEALDVDGPCGGYNLHWAWTCGILAGSDIAQKLKKGQSC